MPDPTSKLRFPYEPTVYPFVSNDPLTAKPVGAGPVAEGGAYLSIQVGLGQFMNPADLYLIYSIPGDSDKLYFTNSDYSVAAYSLDEVVRLMEENRLPEGIEPWKKGITGPVNEIILNSIPASELGPVRMSITFWRLPPGIWTAIICGVPLSI